MPTALFLLPDGRRVSVPVPLTGTTVRDAVPSLPLGRLHAFLRTAEHQTIELSDGDRIYPHDVVLLLPRALLPAVSGW